MVFSKTIEVENYMKMVISSMPQENTTLSPIMTRLGVEQTNTPEDRVLLCDVSDNINNSVGTPHGGFMTSVMHHAAIAELDAILPDTQNTTLRNLDVQYLRAPKGGEKGSLVASARLLARDQNFATLELDLSFGGKQMVKGNATYHIGSPSHPQQDGGGYNADFNLPAIPDIKAGDGFKAVQEASKHENYPPYMNAIQMEFARAVKKPGQVFLKTDLDGALREEFTNAHGQIDETLAISMLDAAAGLAGRSATESGKYTMANLRVHMLGPVPDNAQSLIAIGSLVKPGSKTISTRADVITDDGTHIATAQVDCIPL